MEKNFKTEVPTKTKYQRWQTYILSIDGFYHIFPFIVLMFLVKIYKYYLQQGKTLSFHFTRESPKDPKSS